MKERGKQNDDVSFYNITSSEFSCRKHPSVSVVGICPYCLKDRLISLVCSECGEQRLSSCSCSDLSPNRTSSTTVEAVKISSLIDEETKKQRKESRKTEEVVVFKRSSSSCVEIKRKSNRFSKIGRFFKKIKERDFSYGIDEKNNDSWVLDYNNKLGVSRSRSLCSFRGNGYFIGSEEDGGSSYSGARSSFSAARSSSVNGGVLSNFEGRKSNFSETTENRKSNFEGRKSNFSETTTENRKSNFSETEPSRRSCFEARKSNFSETEYPPPRRSNFSETEYNRTNNPPRRSNYEAGGARRSNFNEEQHRKSDSTTMNLTRRVISMKEESYFSGGEEPGFIDLKFDSSSREVVLNDGVLEQGGGGSCRLSTKGKEMSKSRKSFKGWKWIFGHHHHHHHQQQQHLHHHHRDSR